MDTFTQSLTTFLSLSPVKIPTRTQLRHTYDAFTRSSIGKSFSPDLREEGVSQMLSYSGHTRDLVWAKAMTMPLAPSPSSLSVKKFGRFSELPYELRQKIWEFSLMDERIVEIIYQRRMIRWWAARTSLPASIPALFLSCKESKKVAERVLIRCFGTWINLSSDTIWMNSLKSVEFSDRFMLFCQALWEVCLGGDEDDDGDEQKRWRALYRVKRLMVTWEMWEAAMGHEEGHVIGIKDGEIRNLEGLENLILVMVEYIRDESGRLYEDDRQLKEEDVEEVSGVRNLRIVREVSEEVVKGLKLLDKKINFEFKLVQRGDDGEGGARNELTLFDRRYLDLREKRVADESEQEEMLAIATEAGGDID